MPTPAIVAATPDVTTIYDCRITQVVRTASADEARRRVVEALRIVGALVVPVEIALAVVPELPLSPLFPASDAPAAPLLRLLAAGNAMLVLVATLSTAFQATGRAIVPARILLALVALEALEVRPEKGHFG